MKDFTKDRIRKFSEDREWDRFHSPANLAKSISIEAVELLECFHWSNENFVLDHVKEELPDVIVYCQNMLDKLNLNVDDIVNSKLDLNEKNTLLKNAKVKLISIINYNINPLSQIHHTALCYNLLRKGYGTFD